MSYNHIYLVRTTEGSYALAAPALLLLPFARQAALCLSCPSPCSAASAVAASASALLSLSAARRTCPGASAANAKQMFAHLISSC